MRKGIALIEIFVMLSIIAIAAAIVWPITTSIYAQSHHWSPLKIWLIRSIILIFPIFFVWLHWKDKGRP